ncbi:ribonuclease HII [Candidatus Saccharibacteria bacterium]|nr:ribonuclease HII [Candidatus Saccharibacteria bacterium]
MQKRILGIDEVGRGPYAGPLVIGACILPENRSEHPWIEELNDSKKLSEKKRETLYKIIKENATSATGWVTSKELDEIGMSAALRLATRRAVEKIQCAKVPFNEIIIDGISNFLVGTKLEKYATTMKKADFLIKEVSAASIVAKVERDNYMKDLAKKYPGYGFEKHVGYGTAAHQKAMEKLGLTPEHRRSFAPVKKLTTKEIGDDGENKVAEYLEKMGHQILFRNYKTKLFEIDIVSKKDAKIFFTEVKTRKNSSHGSAREMITKKKLEQMTFAANSFVKIEKIDLDYQLAVGTVENGSIDWFTVD